MSEREVLFHLAYASHRAKSLTDDEIVDRIVLPAMQKNRRLQISGCIWFDAQFFFQVIEGDQEVVLGLYDQIKEDPRHRGPQVLVAQQIGERDFERFSMRLISEGTPAAVRVLIDWYRERALASTPMPAPIVADDVRRMISEISAEFV
ncbi:MAG: BLUF domain-containing protein [Phycisphaerales bacterium JB065]